MKDSRVSIKSLAEELYVSYSTALSYVRTGKIQGKMYGGRWFVDRQEVERFKKEGNHPEAKEVRDE